MRRHWLSGKTSRRWAATNSSAGSRTPSRRRPGSAVFAGPRRNWRTANTGLVAGRAAHTGSAPAGSCGSTARQSSNFGPRPNRIGPMADSGFTSSPCCLTRRVPSSSSTAATSRADSISPRQPWPPTTRAASLGQIVDSGARCRSSARMVAARRVLLPSCDGCSHQASPRSPSAVFASRTRCRAFARSACSAQRAAVSSATSSAAKACGIPGSVARTC